MTGLVLEIQGLYGGYPGTPILSDITFTLTPGHLTVLSGPNGAGKSTLINTLAGHLPATGGRIRLGSNDITGKGAHLRARLGIGLVPQGRRLFRDLTAAEHLSIAARQPGDIARVLELLPGLQQRLSHRPPQLSGGEQQMLSIARGLLTRPTILLLDEPREGLAAPVAAAVMALLPQLAEEGIGILLADPDPNALAHTATNRLTLHRGLLIADAPRVLRPKVKQKRPV
ncbi:MAG TPA: ABC transporter ATP-binding protein [Micromonosporaceae bacterium]|nr:ABC transporter ATP-binding protein [Micromonosporaceae bacterium]HCU49303.1 ABC transporter ATP-binding protein [Micromonosporaceae bacterium]